VNEKAQRVAGEIESLFIELGYARIYWKWRVSAAQSGDPGARKECDEAGVTWQ
jgi:hypothetical protein